MDTRPGCTASYSPTPDIVEIEPPPGRPVRVEVLGILLDIETLRAVLCASSCGSGALTVAGRILDRIAAELETL